MSRHLVRSIAELIDQVGERPNSKTRRELRRRRRADGTPFYDPPDRPDPQPDPPASWPVHDKEPDDDTR